MLQPNQLTSTSRHVTFSSSTPAHLLPIYVILKAAREKEKPYLRWQVTSSAASLGARESFHPRAERHARVCSSLGRPGAGKGEAKVSLLGGADRMLPSRSVKVKTKGWGQGRTHGGRGRPPLELKNAIFSGFLPLNYVICIFQVCFLSCLLHGRTEEACSMTKSLRKVDFSHPTGHYT